MTAIAADQVVKALAARLVPMSETGGRVFTSRRWPITEAEMPAWRVTAEDEEVNQALVSGINEHRLTVNAVCVARDTADLDDQLHLLAGAGLPLLFAAPVPYGLELTQIDRRVATEGESAVGTITLNLRATYYVDPQAPSTILSA